MPPRSFLGVKAKTAYSLRRPMMRSSWIPHVSSRGLKRSWLNGMRYSAVHPAESRVASACQTASHDRSSPASVLVASRRTPAGLMSKENAVWWSW